jgi:two-component system, LuxR family, response regulator FixJ
MTPRGARLKDALVIFVVDDDESVRTAVRRLLLVLRLPIRLFSSAEQFLSDTERSVRGCLILDLKLPGMSGLQLQEQLVDKEWKLPIVFISAHDDEESRDAALRMGAISYLRKPFDRQQFLESVNKAVAAAQA